MAVEARSSTADLEDARHCLAQSFAPLDDVLLDEPGVVGEWSIRRTLAHILAWDAWGIAALQALERGETSTTPDDESMNTESFKRLRGLRGEALQRLLETSRTELVSRLAAMSDAERAQERYQLNDRLISADDFVDGFIDHDREHAAEIRAWRKTRGIC